MKINLKLLLHVWLSVSARCSLLCPDHLYPIVLSDLRSRGTSIQHLDHFSFFCNGGSFPLGGKGFAGTCWVAGSLHVVGSNNMLCSHPLSAGHVSRLVISRTFRYTAPPVPCQSTLICPINDTRRGAWHNSITWSGIGIWSHHTHMTRYTYRVRLGHDTGSLNSRG